MRRNTDKQYHYWITSNKMSRLKCIIQIQKQFVCCLQTTSIKHASMVFPFAYWQGMWDALQYCHLISVKSITVYIYYRIYEPRGRPVKLELALSGISLIMPNTSNVYIHYLLHALGTLKSLRKAHCESMRRSGLDGSHWFRKCGWLRIFYVVRTLILNPHMLELLWFLSGIVFPMPYNCGHHEFFRPADGINL